MNREPHATGFIKVCSASLAYVKMKNAQAY